MDRGAALVGVHPDPAVAYRRDDADDAAFVQAHVSPDQRRGLLRGAAALRGRRARRALSRLIRCRTCGHAPQSYRHINPKSVRACPVSKNHHAWRARGLAYAREARWLALGDVLRSRVMTEDRPSASCAAVTAPPTTTRGLRSVTKFPARALDRRPRARRRPTKASRRHHRPSPARLHRDRRLPRGPRRRVASSVRPSSRARIHRRRSCDDT